MHLNKRKRFYVSADIFDHGLSAQAIAVFAFLSRCAGKDGIAFPSVSTIAGHCHIAESTVRTSIAKLEKCGLLCRQTHYVMSSNGKRRQTSNRYHLMGEQSGSPPPLNQREDRYQLEYPPPPAETEEINNKYKDIRERTSVCRYEQEELTDLLDGLSVYTFEDEHFVNAIEIAIRDMWNADNTRINGMEIPRDKVRERLRLLNTDCIDRIWYNMREYGNHFQNAGGYLKTCLYNAPLDFNTDVAAFKAAL